MSASQSPTERLAPPAPAGQSDVTLMGGGGFVAITSTPLPTPRDRFPRIPGYAVQCELGRGGMGVVYRASQERLNRMVAVKMLLHPDGGDVSDVVRFRSEAEAVAAIAHPHVVKVFESGQADGRPYFAMEYLSGGTLHARVKALAPFAPDDAALLVEKLARAVHAAHSIGIVHRDLKPGNVLFDAAGEPRVTDFGLAKRVACELTKTQAVMGTPAYMPPEQAAGRAKYVGPPADIYALGVILYECLTGATPFTCEDSLVLLNQVIADEPPSIRQKAPRVPRDLELICFKCLEKGPADRYQTAAELAEDLRRFAAREPVSVRPAGLVEKAVKWAKRRPTLAAAYGLGALVAALAVFGGGAATLAVQTARARDDASRNWQMSEEAYGKLEQQAGELERARAVADGHWKAAEKARDELAAMNTETRAALEREQVALKSESSALAEANNLRQEAVVSGYFHNVGFAYREMQEGNFIRAQQLLDECPERLRGWEWRHVYRCTHPQIGSGVSKYMSFDMVLDADGMAALGCHVTGGVTAFDFRTGKGAMVPDKQTVAVEYGTRLSADGTRMLVVSRMPQKGKEGERVTLVNPKTGERLVACGGPDDVLTTLSLSDDGKRAFVLFGKTAVCYDLVTGKAVGRFASGDDAYLLGEAKLRPSGDGAELPIPVGLEVHVWDGTDSPPASVARVPAGFPTAAALTDDRQTVVAGTSTGGVVICHRGTKTTKQHPSAHSGYVLAVTTFADKYAATAGDDGVVKVWDLKTGEPVRTFVGLHGKALSLRFEKGGRHVIATDDAFLFHIFALADEEAARYPLSPEVRDGFYTADRTLERRFTAFAGSPKAVVHTPAGDRWEVPTPAGQGVSAAAFSPVGQGLVVGGSQGRVEWRDEPAAGAVNVGELFSYVRTLSFTPDGKRLLAASGTEWVVWDTVTKEAVCRRKQANSVAALSPDGKWVALSLDVGPRVVEVVGVDGDKGGVIESVEHVTAVAFSPDGKKVLAALGGRGIAEFPRSTGGDTVKTPTRSFQGHTTLVTCIGFSADGTRMMSGSADGRVKVWDTGTGLEAVGLYAGRRVEVREAWFTPDGKTLATTSPDRPPVVFDGNPRYKAYKPPGRER